MKSQEPKIRFHRLVAFGFLVFTAAGWLRMIDSIADWYWLTLAGVSPGPLYLALTGALWGLVGGFALVWLLFRLPRRRLVSFSAAVLFAASYWADRLLIRNPETATNDSFASIFTVILLCFAFWAIRPDKALQEQ